MAVRVRMSIDAEAGNLASTVQRAVSKGFQGAGRSGLATDPQGIVNQIMGTGDKPFDKRMWRYKGVYRNIITPELPDVPASFFTKGQAQRAQFLKNFGFIGAPILAPTSMLGNLFATRQIFSAFQGEHGQRLLGGVGLSGIGGAALATGATMGAALALGMSLKALERAVREVTDAFGYARSLYGKASTSGLGTKFTQFRSSIAETLGISEEEVFRFGAAMAYLAPKLKWANEVISQNNREAATAAVQFGIMKQNLRAMGTAIAADLLPAIIKFTGWVESLVKKITASVQSHEQSVSTSASFGDFLKKYNMQGTRDVKTGAVKFFAGDFGKQDMGPSGPLLNPYMQKRFTDLWHQFLTQHPASKGGLLPDPQAFMKQLPASAFERMGLVIKGFGPGNDYARRTALATEKTAKALNAMISGGGVPRAYQFFNPVANSP